MRWAIQLAMGVAAMSLTAGAHAADTTKTANAPTAGMAWCGFHDKAGARVRCGFSSEAQCRQTLGPKGTICIIDPYRT